MTDTPTTTKEAAMNESNTNKTEIISPMETTIELSWVSATSEYKRNYPGGKQMPAHVFRELITLIDYVAPDDELKHFKSMQESNDDCSRHIYHSIKRIMDWMGCWGEDAA